MSTWATDKLKELKRGQVNDIEQLDVAAAKVIKANQEICLLHHSNIKLDTQSRRNSINFFLISRKARLIAASKKHRRLCKSCLLINLKCLKKLRWIQREF